MGSGSQQVTFRGEPLETARAHVPAARHAAVLALFCALTALMLAPLIRHPASLTAGWEGDNLFCIRQFWWVKRAILDWHQLPFFDPSTYYPVGHHVVNGELFPATTIPAIPITAVWGPVVAYNVTLLFTFVMTGFGTYLWVSRLTGSVEGGIIAGVIAAFLPYRFAHLPGHLHMVSTHWMPWSLYAVDRFVERKSAARGAAIGVTVGLVALSSWYYAYAIGLVLPLYVVVRSRPWRENWTREWWLGLTAALATASVVIVPFLAPYLRLRAAGGLVRSFDEMEAWSLNFYDFLLPNRLNPSWAYFMLRRFPLEAEQWSERGVSLGYTALVLAGVALLARKRPRALRAAIAVAAVTYLISLGPTLHSDDRQVLVPVGAGVAALAAKSIGVFPSLGAVRARILSENAVPIPLPAMLMFVFVPLTSGMRVMSRFGVWTGLMTAALAGAGIQLIIAETRRLDWGRRWIPAFVVGAACLLVLVESRSEVDTIRLEPRPADVWLARHPGGAVVELPLEQTFRSVQDYYKTVHGHPTVFGPVGDGFRPPILWERRSAVLDFPSSASIAALREWKVAYVLLTPSLIPGWATLKPKLDTSAPGLLFDRELSGVLIYRIP
jgi:hypothetical protein